MYSKTMIIPPKRAGAPATTLLDRMHRCIDACTLYLRNILCLVTCGALVTESRIILPRHAALVSEAAYRSAEIYRTPITDLISDHETDAQAAVLHFTPRSSLDARLKGTYTLIVFRGSQSLTDWLMNIAYRFSSPCEALGVGVRCHTGFRKQWEALRPRILETLRASPCHRHIVCTGHSLGGGVATLAALDLSIQGFTNIDLITFGSPRVFNPTGVEVFRSRNIRTYRVKNGADIVTIVPLIRMRHVCPASCIGTSLLLYSIRNHHIDDYVRILQAYTSQVSRVEVHEDVFDAEDLQRLEQAMHNPTCT